MHTKTLKKLALLLTFWLALYSSSLRAQTFTAPLQASTTGTDAVDFEFRASGVMIAKGDFGYGSLLSADQGDGTRMLWFPSIAAFRAGGVNSSGAGIGYGYWDAPQLGTYSAAFGYNNQASGEYSMAFGNSNQATGTGSTASGYFDTASGSNSLALGESTTASGYNALAMGAITTAQGGNSFAKGFLSMASGLGSTALGYQTTASGLASTASGYGTLAWGKDSTASGSYSSAYGLSSTASGNHLTASAAYSFAVGAFNLGGGNRWSWVTTDPLFEVGNGTSTTPSDALVVYKNGDAALQGSLTVAPAGDIPMYTGH